VNVEPDSLDMWGAAAAVPEQLTAALATAHDVFEHAELRRSRPREVVALGLGTGGIACRAAQALTSAQMPVPFRVEGGPGVPGFVGPESLVFAVSSSGDTPETVEGGEAAIARGARVVALGGVPDSALALMARDHGLPWCPNVAGTGPLRAALGAVTVPLLVALGAAGLAPDCASAVEASSVALRRRLEAGLAPDGPPTVLARRIGRTISLLYAAQGPAAVAAQWWKAEVNRNAKAPAFAATLPELTYGELAGWGQDGDVTRQTMTLVFLRHAGEGAPLGALFDRVRQATDEVMADVLEVWADGADDLGCFFDLALTGTLVSLTLARREGVDPGPVPAIDEAHEGTKASPPHI
jgi:glucose/mannose-6-phosphate isomerase